MRSKKFVIVYAVVIFLIVFLITFNSVCSVSQFDVRFHAGSAQMTAAAKRVQERLDEEYLNKSFLFFKESSIADVVAEEGGGYLKIDSIEKHFPNRISVSVREVYECYAYEKDGWYYAVGDDGTVLAVNNANVNNIDGRNVEVVGFRFEDIAVGEKFAVSEKQAAAFDALQAFLAKIEEKGLRGNILRVEYIDMGVSDPDKNFTWFYIDCVEGIRIRIVKPEVNTEEKVSLAVSGYLGEQIGGGTIGDAQRTHGYITVQDSGGQVRADYSEEKPEDWGVGA